NQVDTWPSTTNGPTRGVGRSMGKHRGSVGIGISIRGHRWERGLVPHRSPVGPIPTIGAYGVGQGGALRRSHRRRRPKGTPMPRFSANLGHLFVEYPLIERIGAAARAGFKAIELQLPYDLSPSTVKAEIDRHGLTMLNINSPQGP